MPVVRPQRRVLTDPLPNVRATAAETELSAGVGLARAKGTQGQAIAGVGRDLGGLGLGLYRQALEQADDIKDLESSNALSRIEADLMYDPDTGALNVHGKAAMPLIEQVGAEFEKRAAEVGSTMTTAKQKARFFAARERTALNINVALRRHVSNEIDQVNKTEYAAYEKNQISAAIQSAHNPLEAADKVAELFKQIDRNAPRFGWDGEMVEAKKAAARSAVHVGAITTLLAEGQDRKAKAWFEEAKAKNQIDGDALPRLTAAVEEGSTRGEGQKEADRIIASGGGMTEWREAAKKIEDPKVRDDVMTRVEHEGIIRRQAQNEQEEANSLTAYNIIDRTHSIKSIPPALWTSLSGPQRSAMRGYAKNLAEGVATKTDQRTWYALIDQAMNDRQSFIDQPLLDYRHKLSDSDFQQLTMLKLSMKNGQDKAVEAALDGFRTNQQILDDTLALAGIVEKENPEKVATLRRMVEDRVETLQRQTGKKAQNADVQIIADDLLKSITVQKGGWFNFFPGGEPFSDVTKRAIDITVADIPSTERAQVEAALKSKGKPITDAAILNLYIANQRKAGNLK